MGFIARGKNRSGFAGHVMRVPEWEGKKADSTAQFRTVQLHCEATHQDSFVPTRRILFVDDEPGIRNSLAPLLRHQGHAVTTAATVPEALKHIYISEFDVLVADLNIGEPGDGFTLASAMRRTHPNCLNMILTGYPAVETALHAIHSQVDHFLVKPIRADTLLGAVEQRFNPGTQRNFTPVSMADFLRQHGTEIIGRTLAAMKSDQEIGALALSDGDRVDHLPAVFTRLAALLGSAEPGETSPDGLLEAAKHGLVRKRQGYSADMLADDRRLLGKAIHEVVQDNLLELNISRVIPDLQRINESLDFHLKAALVAYNQAP